MEEPELLVQINLLRKQNTYFEDLLDTEIEKNRALNLIIGPLKEERKALRAEVDRLQNSCTERGKTITRLEEEIDRLKELLRYRSTGV